MNRLLLPLIAVVALGRVAVAGMVEPPCPIKVAFGPECERVLIRHIHDAHKEIKAAIYEFTKKAIADALIERAERGIKVTVKVDAHEAEYQYTQEILAKMAKAKIKIEHIKMPFGVKMHDKFAIIDGQCVVTGSYNWTKRATEDNYENLLAIESPVVAEEYAAEWDRIKSSK